MVEEAREFEEMHRFFARTFAKLKTDYSLESLQRLDWLFQGFREKRETASGSQRESMDRIASAAGAYVTEVLRRACPRADVSRDGECLVVTLPSRLDPGWAVQLRPGARTELSLYEDQALFAWALVSLAMAELQVPVMAP